MKACVVIPCYNHPGTIEAVATSALAHAPVLIVDDGSTVNLTIPAGCLVLRLPFNQGKGAALAAGFARVAELGFSHAITMDADGQHFAQDLPRFLAAALAQPEALIVGVRDFYAAGCPTHRRRSNAVSTFWFRVETGIRLGDSQCGFRCYPLALALRLKPRSGRFAFELEIMVRAAWLGVAIVPLTVHCTYQPDQLRLSHFRPVRDLFHITIMNIGLVLQSWCVPQPLRAAWSVGEHKSWREAGREFFGENAHEPGRLACAVGLGLFFGIAPIWGYQMIAAATAAHLLRLNKAIAIVASNISIPPMMPLIFYGALALGHWLFTGHPLSLTGWRNHPRADWLAYFWQWIVGSMALAVLVGAAGMGTAYGLARWVKQR